jgi:hypothetical protein
MTACGVIQIARVAGNHPELPSSQGYIGTGGDMFRPRPRQFAIPGPRIGVVAPRSDWIGTQWAPGQGGDTPGGGGAALIGETTAVETAWIQNGLVTPTNVSHAPGSVGFTGARRGRA